MAASTIWKSFFVFYRFWSDMLSNLIFNFKLYTHVMNDFFRINFSPQKQGVVHYMRYIFETSKFTLFLDLTLQ